MLSCRKMVHTNYLALISCLLLISLSVEAAKHEVAPIEPKKPDGKLHSTQFIENVTLSEKEGNAQVKEICGRTRNAVLCERAVTAQSNETDTIDPRFVLLQQVKLMFGVTVLAYTDYLEMIQVKENYENKATKIFLECMEAYAQAGRALRDGIKSCKDEDVNTVASHVQSGMRLYETCEAKYEEAKVITPMKETNDFLTSLGVNSIAIAEAMDAGTL